MAQIVECVPNFSEGIDQQTIDAIADAIRSTAGVSLLDVDAGRSTNRTVYSFVGTPSAVVEAALCGARVARTRIDMRTHRGAHKRLGALDVCPFVPVTGVTMDDCVRCAHEFGRRLAAELEVPVFLYGHAATHDYRREVPQIRAGEYEQLATGRLADPRWAPDYGPARFVPTWGATIVGARNFLLAYNVNLIATKEQAHRIALLIRGTVRPNGEPGRLRATQAMGWYLAERNIAQVTVNILDHHVTSLAQVYEEVCREAAKLKLPVTGSELVGLAPLDSLLAVADHYVRRESLFVLDEDQRVTLAVNRLGLNSLAPFDPHKRIIEYMVRAPDSTDRLVCQSVATFARSVGDRTTAPGGGSVGAVVGTLGAALAAMVAKLAFGKKAFESTDAQMRLLIPPLHHSVATLTALVDADTDAFTEYGLATKLPDDTEDNRLIREEAMRNGLRKAIAVPMQLAEHISGLWPHVERLVALYHVPTTSDLQVAVQCLRTAVYAASYNVRINLRAPEAKPLRAEFEQQIEQYVQLAEQMVAKLLPLIDQRQSATSYP